MGTSDDLIRFVEQHLASSPSPEMPSLAALVTDTDLATMSPGDVALTLGRIAEPHPELSAHLSDLGPRVDLQGALHHLQGLGGILAGDAAGLSAVLPGDAAAIENVLTQDTNGLSAVLPGDAAAIENVLTQDTNGLSAVLAGDEAAVTSVLGAGTMEAVTAAYDHANEQLSTGIDAASSAFDHAYDSAGDAASSVLGSLDDS